MSTRATEAEKERMRKLRADGMTYPAIGLEVGRHRKTVAMMCDPERWASRKAYEQTPARKAAGRARQRAPECAEARRALYNAQEHKNLRREYYNSPQYKEHHKAYRQTPEYKAKRKAYLQSPEYKEYCRTPERRLSMSLRNRLNQAIRNEYKAGSAVRDLGCTINELKAHLEALFSPGMNWDNWELDGWHIDHIKPLASFDLTDREQFLEACHYTNLQPLWAKENLSKGCAVTQGGER